MNTNTVSNDVAVGHALYFDSSTAMLRFDDQCMRLDHKTFQLLCYFVAHHDQIVERRALMNHLWKDQYASDASLGRLISVLRKILAVNGHKFIFTIHKTGYRFVIPADVRFVAANPTVRKMPSSNVHSLASKRSEPLSVEQPQTVEQPLSQGGSEASASTDPQKLLTNAIHSDNSVEGNASIALTSASETENTKQSIAAKQSTSEKAERRRGRIPRFIKLRYFLISHFWVALVILTGIYWDLNSRHGNLDVFNSQRTSQTAQLNNNRIVILPFEQLLQARRTKESNDNVAFIAGLSTEIVNSLTKINGLQVVDKHESAKYIENTIELNSIAVDHSARYVLKGNLRMQQTTLRVGVQVVDTMDENILISAVYEHNVSDGFDAQIDIATQVAAEFQQTLKIQKNR